MSQFSFRSSAPDAWVEPRPYSDACLRRQKHGAIQPMEAPGLFERFAEGVRRLRKRRH